MEEPWGSRDFMILTAPSLLVQTLTGPIPPFIPMIFVSSILEKSIIAIPPFGPLVIDENDSSAQNQTLAFISLGKIGWR
jgi:hypothetical protein